MTARAFAFCLLFLPVTLSARGHPRRTRRSRLCQRIDAGLSQLDDSDPRLKATGD